MRMNDLTPARLTPIVIRFGRVGDMVMLSPLLNLLHRRYGMPCWLIGSGPWSAALYRAHPDVAAVWSVGGRHTPLLLSPTWWRVFKLLRFSGQSPIYICETAAMRQLKRIKQLLALAGVAAERCVFITEDASIEGGEHRVDNLLRFGKQTPSAFQADHSPLPEFNYAPKLFSLETERFQCEAWIKAQGWYGRPLVLVHPGNRRSMRRHLLSRERIDDKAWSASNWSSLLKGVHESLPAAQILLCGSAQELAMLREIESDIALPEVTAMQLPLPRLLALCEIAHSTISVDTGPAHIAAAMGSPLVVLFGNTSARHWLPRSVNGAMVISLGGAPAVKHVNEISPDAVLGAWKSLPSSL
jgi:ADP-heptose:LPS heptosyltransferase